MKNSWKRNTCSLRRMVAVFLCIIMIVEVCPSLGFASSDAILLPVCDPGDAPDMISFATQSSSVDEGLRYIVTVNRSGDAADEAYVNIETVDVSASYGADYFIVPDETETQILETEGTLLEQATDYTEQAERLGEAQEIINNINSAALESVTADEEPPAEEAKEDSLQSVYEPDEEAAPAEETYTADDEKSTLAKMKEAQTGLPTRETAKTKFVPIEQLLMQNSVDEFGSLLETSSVTTITFAPGEVTKTFIVEIADDDESEGTEAFDIVFGEMSEGYSVGNGVNVTLTIADDEPVVHSVLSFSDAKYSAENNTATITVTRAAAPYSFCTAMVRTVATDNAQEGTDYAKVDAAITFEPFLDEFTFDIPVSQSDRAKSFDIELYDIKGAAEGDITTATVTIPRKNSEVKTAGVKAAAEADDKQDSFTITMDKTYTVRYVPGESMGQIYDTDYTPEVLVGDYYFTRNSSYGHYSGYSSPSDRSSKFTASEGPNGAGYCEWYDWRTWKNGSSYFYLNGKSKAAFNTGLYQYISVDWKQTSKKYGGQRVGFSLHDPYNKGLNAKKKTIEKTGQFESKQMSSRLLFLNNSELPVWDDVDIRVYAIDKEDNRTPVIRLYCYGVAAMYRRFNIDLIQPQQLTYRTADGKTIQQAPAQVTLGEGHDTRYYDQNLQFKVSETAPGEPVKGNIVKYIITTGTSPEKQQTFEYTPKGDNKTSIKFDSDFIKLVDKYTSQVSVNNDTYSTTLRIQPVFEYKNVEVEILENVNGTFADSSLSAGKHTFHIGDTIRLEGIPANDNLYYVGYNEKAYKNKADTAAVISGDMDGTRDIFLDNERYVLKPRFSNQQNHIRINMTDAAKEKLTVLNTVPEEYLPDSIKSGDGLVLNTGDTAYSYAPAGGMVYSIKAVAKKQAPSGKIYRPVFTVSSSTERINGYAFDFVAADLPADNIITIDVEEVDTSKLKYFQITGHITVPGNALRSSAFNVTEAGVMGTTVIAGGKQTKLFDTASQSVIDTVDRPSAVTDGEGAFAVTGIYATDNDRITISISNGDVCRVEYLTLSSTGISPEDIQFTERIYNEDTHQTVDTPVVKPVYTTSCQTINLPIRSPLAPYVSNLTYETEWLPDIDVDTRDNAIPILTTALHVNADINLNGREVKTVVFTRVSKNGSRHELEVDAAHRQQTRFTATYPKMDIEFEDGDMLYVSLIDAEDRRITASEDGSTTYEERRYFDVFTGLTFYIPELEVEPQTYNLETTTSVEIPILGDMAPTMQSGALAFTKERISDEPNAPYYYQFLFSPGASNIDKVSAYNMLEKVKESNNKNYNEINSSPDTEQEYLSNSINRMFDPDSAKTPEEMDEEIKSKAWNKSVTEMTSSVKFDVHSVILLSFYFSYIEDEADPTGGRYEMTMGQYAICTSVELSKLFYWTVYGVPMYLKIGGRLMLDLSGNYVVEENAKKISETDFKLASNLEDLLEPDTTLMAGLGATLNVGVGICGVLSARGIVSVDIVARSTLISHDKTEEEIKETEGFLFRLAGGFGIDLLVFSFEYVPSLFTYGAGSYADVGDGVVSISSKSSKSRMRSNSDTEDASAYFVRGLNAGSSNHELFGKSIRRAAAGEETISVLLDNVAERTRPQLVAFENGKKALFFIDGDKDRAGLNALCLYYSIADADGHWSPVAKVDDNGTADSMPKISVFGNKCIVSWSDAKREFDEDTEPKEALAAFEVAYATFNAEREELSAKTVITDDEMLDNNLSFGYGADGIKYCYYLKRDIMKANLDTDLVDANATYSTLAMRTYDDVYGWGEEQLLHIPCEKVNDPLIIDFDSVLGEYNGHTYALLTYTVDMDTDLTTVDDRDVYLMLTSLDEQKSYYPIKITNDYKADISPRLTKINKDVYLSWVKDGKDFCMLNISEAVREIDRAEIPDMAGKLELLLAQDKAQPDWYRMSAQELGLDAEEYEGSIFEDLALHGITPQIKNFSTDKYTERNIGSYNLHNKNDTLYLTWVDTTKTADGVSAQEVFGAVFEKTEDIDRHSDWGEAVQLSDFGKTVDEISVAFDNDGTMLISANMFSQYIENSELVTSPNSLILFEADHNAEFALADGLEFETAPRPNEATNIRFGIKNTGLLASNEYTVNVSAVRGSEETSLYSMTFTEPLVSGHTTDISVPWTVPDSIDNMQIKLEVTSANEADNTFVVYKDITKEAKLVINDTKAYFDEDGRAFVKLSLENTGNINASNVTITANSSAGPRGDKTVKEFAKLNNVTVAAGKESTITLPLTEFTFDDMNSRYGHCEVCLTVTDGVQTAQRSSILYTNKIMAISIDCNDSIVLSKGAKKEIGAKVLPLNVKGNNLYYYSSAPDIATVSQEGVITAGNTGNAVITVYYPDTFFKKDISVTVASGSGSSHSGGGGGTSADKKPNSPTNEATDTQEPPFADVPKTSWYAEDVLWAYNNKIMKGTSQTTFDPEAGLTRGMLVTTLGRLAEIDEKQYSGSDFSDVDLNSYYAPYVKWAAENGIVHGYGDGLFKPNELVTREQAAKIILGFEVYLGNGPTGVWAVKLPYTDTADISPWAVEGVMYCTMHSIMKGNDKEEFLPAANMKRSEAAAVLHRLTDIF